MDALWIIEELRKNENIKVTIVLPDGGGIIDNGILTGDLDFSNQASYADTGKVVSELMKGTWTGLTQAAEGVKLAGQALAGIMRGIGTIAEKLSDVPALLGMGSTLAGSVQYWTNSTLTLPPIQFTLVAIRPTDNPLLDARKILKLCLPGDKNFADRISDAGKGGLLEPITSRIGSWMGSGEHDLFFWSPNGYSPVAAILKETMNRWDDKNPTSGIPGTLTLKIGKWFEADCLIPTSVNATVSPQTTPNGVPLYVNCSVTFTTYRMMKGSEYDKFFKPIL